MYCQAIEGNYLVQIELISAGTKKLIDSSTKKVKIDAVGRVYDIETGELVYELAEDECALISQRQPVTKLLIGFYPDQKYISQCTFIK